MKDWRDQLDKREGERKRLIRSDLARGLHKQSGGIAKPKKGGKRAAEKAAKKAEKNGLSLPSISKLAIPSMEKLKTLQLEHEERRVSAAIASNITVLSELPKKMTEAAFLGKHNTSLEFPVYFNYSSRESNALRDYMYRIMPNTFPQIYERHSTGGTGWRFTEQHTSWVSGVEVLWPLAKEIGDT